MMSDWGFDAAAAAVDDLDPVDAVDAVDADGSEDADGSDDADDVDVLIAIRSAGFTPA